ncbi:MAG: hypothetical protein GAK29_01473 [Acinetobacter bereziniae]|uniref:Uncharacterized protein n=1 Tax=Acinetobacter bereziniae TaxID=106648 RepID=A0A833PH11_ACIBZ|nr:MAG: hypothetical protein GAK29_01473 [Acinetobacter bereziniae]
MSKFKINDHVEIVSVGFLTKNERITMNVKVGDSGKVIGFYRPAPVVAIIENNKFTNSNAGEGKLFIPMSSLKKLNSFYLESNRHKLYQAIKATGFHAEKLSLASNHAKTYFTGFTAESRFNSRGDITEERLNSLLTTLEFAERELLGVGAKTVDEKNVSLVEEKTTMIVGDTKFEGTLSEFKIFLDKTLSDEEIKLMDSSEYKKIAEDFESGMQESINEPKNQSDLYSEYFDSANKRIQEKKDAKVRNFLIVFLVFVVLLALWFFFK